MNSGIGVTLDKLNCIFSIELLDNEVLHESRKSSHVKLRFR